MNLMNLMWLKEILKDPFISFFSIILAIISIVLAFVFYFKSRRNKKILFSTYNRTIIESGQTALADLEIFYKNQKQERITISKLGIWNAGSEPVRQNDIPTASPLSIEVAEGADVLSVIVLFTTDDANHFLLGDIQKPAGEKKHTQVPFSFDYFDKGEGAVVQIAHSGDALHDIKVTGKVIGGPPLEYITSPHERWSVVMKKMAGNPYTGRFSLLISFIWLVIGAIVILKVSKISGILIAVFGTLFLLVCLSQRFSTIPQDILKKMK